MMNDNLKMVSPPLNFRTILIFICVFTFVFSAFFSFYYRISPTTDAKAYNKIATNLALGRGYIERKENMDNPKLDDAIVRVGPGYEFFLAMIYKFLDIQIELVWLFHAALRALTAYFLYKLSLQIFFDSSSKKIISLMGAALFGLTPDLIVIGGMLLAETLFLFLLVISVYYSILLLRHGKMSYVWLASVFWGSAALVRPTALPMMFLLVLFLAYKQKWMYVVVVPVFSIVFLGGWSVRNSLMYERPLFTTTAGYHALLVGNNAGATGGYDKTPQIQVYIDNTHSVELSQEAFKYYLAFIIHRPFKYIEVQFRKTVTYFSLIRPTGFWFYLQNRPLHRVFTFILSAVYTAFLFIVGIAGIYKYFSTKLSEKLFLLGLIVLQPLAVIPLYVETRYRYPLFLFLVVFSAYGLFLFAKEFSKWENKKIILSVAIILILISAVDLIFSYDTVSQRLDFIRKEIVDESQL